jgi:hypothetical protein
MTRAALIAAALLATAAAIAHATPGATRRPSLSDARICSGAYRDNSGTCQADQRARLPLYPEVRCSVHVDAPRPTRFTAQLFFNGKLERTDSLVLSGRRTRAIAVAFRSLGDVGDYGVPGGSYTCRFTLGATRASVTGVSRGPTASVRAPAACELNGQWSPICNLPQPVVFTSPHTLSCSVVLVSQIGHLATTDLQRNDGGTWTTLYHAEDQLNLPIAEVWAYTSAPPGQFFASGDYRCNFSLDGQPIAARTFSVRN